MDTNTDHFTPLALRVRGKNMDKYGTDRTLFQGSNEIFQMPSNEMILSSASRAAMLGFLPAEGETGRSCGGLLVE